MQAAPRGQGGQPLVLRLNDQLGSALDRLKRYGRVGSMNNNNLVAGFDGATFQNDGHDPSLPDQSSFSCAVKHCGQKASLEGFNLSAGVSESGDLNHCFGTQAKLRTGAEAKQVDALGRDVLAHLALCDHMSELQNLRK